VIYIINILIHAEKSELQSLVLISRQTKKGNSIKVIRPLIVLQKFLC
jgi:WD40 repeat protein